MNDSLERRSDPLASFLDGTLDSHSRDNVLASLDASQDNLAVLADASALLAELRPAQMPSPCRRRGAGLAEHGLGLRQRSRLSPRPSSGKHGSVSYRVGVSLAARLTSNDVSAVSPGAPWPARRGTSLADPSGIAVRVGADSLISICWLDLVTHERLT